MRHIVIWTLLALVPGACAIPNIEIVDSLDSSGSSSHAGKSSSSGGKGSTSTDAGGAMGGTDDAASAGEPAGGTSGGGSDATGGTGNGGTGNGGTPPTAGTGGGSTMQSALVKFCNEVTINNASVDFELRVGSGARQVSISAMSGTCTPAVQKKCVPIPSGPAVPVNVYDDTGTQVWEAQTEILPGQAWVFSFYYDDAKQSVAFAGNGDFTPSECSSTDFSDLFPSD